MSALAGDLPRRIGHILAGPAPVSLGFLKAFMLSMAAFLLTVVPLFAGALDRAALDRAQLERDMRLLLDAQVDVRVATGTGGARVSASASEVKVSNSSLRELVALAYGVVPGEVAGRDWLDFPRYDIHAGVRGSVADPEHFDPAALRGLVTRLLAARFNLEIHVNHLCQQPCGPRALAPQPGR